MPENGGFFGDINQWFILIPLIILIVVSFVMKRRRGEKNPQEIAAALILDLNANHKIMEGFNFQQPPKKLKTGSWQRNNAKLDFLDKSLRSDLSQFFKLAEDFNLQVESAKRYKSISYLSGISVEKLQEPLAKSRDGLQEWLKVNLQQVGPAAGRGGCLGGGLGGGMGR